jgi:molybdate transport system ATP-binding protein
MDKLPEVLTEKHCHCTFLKINRQVHFGEKSPMTPLVSLRQASLRMRDRVVLEGITWEIRAGEHWVVIGPNGAGKSTLVKALIGDVPIVRGEIFPFEPVRLRRQAACLSFESQRGLIAKEERRDEQHAFSGRLDSGARVGDFIHVPRRGATHRPPDIFERIQIAPLLDRRLRDLSSGEMRRFQIGLALSRNPRLLILDEPYEGLDEEYQAELTRIINELMGPEHSVVMVTHRRSEIPRKATHMIGVNAGRIVFQGRREELSDAKQMDILYASPAVLLSEMLPAVHASSMRSCHAPLEVLVDLRNVTVRHGTVPVFENLSWTVRNGQHWAVCGPNGSGKSTLMSLVVGDHPQAYANTVCVFGKRRGSGGSIRETKADIGLISAELQVRYRKTVTTVDAVISGFFDSIGLYRKASPDQAAAAGAWINSLGLQALAGKRFNHLSNGEQRMVLLARSMVKLPRLLVLDEPCQGLDIGNRRLILQAIDRIAATGLTTILFVSHHIDEIPACISHYLILIRKDNQPSRAIVSNVPFTGKRI